MVWSDGTATAAPSADMFLRNHFKALSLEMMTLDGFADDIGAAADSFPLEYIRSRSVQLHHPVDRSPEAGRISSRDIFPLISPVMPDIA